jgi:hypothetical protein
MRERIFVLLAGVHRMQYSMQYIYFYWNEFNFVKFNCLFFARVYAEIVQINFGIKSQKLMSRNSVMHSFMQ